MCACLSVCVCVYEFLIVCVRVYVCVCVCARWYVYLLVLADTRSYNAVYLTRSIKQIIKDYCQRDTRMSIC